MHLVAFIHPFVWVSACIPSGFEQRVTITSPDNLSVISGLMQIILHTRFV